MRKVRTPHRPQKFKSYRNVGFFVFRNVSKISSFQTIHTILIKLIRILK